MLSVYHSFSISREGRLRLKATKSDLGVGVEAAADSLALVPFPEDLWQSIVAEGVNEAHILDRASWDAPADSHPTLPRFVGEFKRNNAAHNRNQLLIDMATFHSQLRALNVTELLWGATYARGRFETFSSHRSGTMVRDLDLTHNVVPYVPATQQTALSSHGASLLTDPVDFLRCYSFLAKLAISTGQFLESLESCSAATVISSMRASAWRAPSPPPTIPHAKSEIRSAVDVGTSSKRPKPDSDSDGGGDGGGGNPKRPKRMKEPGGAARGTTPRRGRSATRGDTQGKGRAHAGGNSGGEAHDRMESSDNALHDDSLDYRASVGSGTLCEERRIEAQMATQPTPRSLNRGLLEAHTVPRRPATPPFDEIEKWRSSISI